MNARKNEILNVVRKKKVHQLFEITVLVNMIWEYMEIEKTYIYTHKRVRNDDHCPICRMSYISLHETLEEAYDRAARAIDELMTDTREYLLKHEMPVWIDEWERRRNGDQYYIFKVMENVVYDVNDTYEKNEFEYGENGEIQYMCLHTRVRKNEWCPDNIKFEVSFHRTLESAHNKCSNMIEYDRECNEWEYDGDEYERNTDIIKKLEPLWIELNDSEGDHYQIIKIKYNTRICLNKYCDKIQPDVWEEQKSD